MRGDNENCSVHFALWIKYSQLASFNRWSAQVNEDLNINYCLPWFWFLEKFKVHLSSFDSFSPVLMNYNNVLRKLAPPKTRRKVQSCSPHPQWPPRKTHFPPLQQSSIQKRYRRSLWKRMEYIEVQINQIFLHRRSRNHARRTHIRQKRWSHLR